jgi:prepilin-type N-terminal cleavage/methylation domain-containing protein
MKRQRPRTTSHQRARAFTLTELIVVITIILILLAVSIPTFRSTIAASESSNAETKLRLALLSGRNAALHADSGADTAVVFFFEPGGRTSAVVCEYAGSIEDNSESDPVDRDIFVPIPNFEPIQLPQGWMVRGFAPAGTMALGAGSSNVTWYDGNRYDTDVRNWIFPETGFYDAFERDDGGDRQSFMIRFVGGIGSVALGDSREALVISPRPTAAGRTTAPWANFRVDIGNDTLSVVRKAILRFESFAIFGGGADPLTKLFGDSSGDTVLCRSIEQVALYKAADLASAIGSKLDRDTGSFYQDKPNPKYVLTVLAKADDIPRWIEGNTNLNDDWIVDDEDDLPVARIYTVQRYTGALQPIPLLDLERSGDKPGGNQ